MKRYPAILFLMVVGVNLVLAQGEIDLQKKDFYQDERTWAFHIRNNGTGVNYRYGKRIDGYRKSLYLIQFDHIKSMREKKIPAENSYSYRTYVYGKLNYFYSLKGGIGLQRELFWKQDIGSISIRYFYNFGLSVGLLKPIYYEIDQNSSGVLETQKFDGNSHISPGQIQGRASFTRGFSEISFIPGIYGKFGFTFEYSKDHSRFHAIELGIMNDAYIKRIPIMYSDDKRQQDFLYPMIFLTYRVGKVLDSKFKTGPNRIDRFLSR